MEGICKGDTVCHENHRWTVVGFAYQDGATEPDSTLKVASDLSDYCESADDPGLVPYVNRLMALAERRM